MLTREWALTREDNMLLRGHARVTCYFAKSVLMKGFMQEYNKIIVDTCNKQDYTYVYLQSS